MTQTTTPEDTHSDSPHGAQGVLDTAGSARDEFASLAMMGMLAHPRRYCPREGDPEDWHRAMATEACELADALIAELDKRPLVEAPDLTTNN